MLIYALLHLTGYALPIDELKNFRQLHSKTAGHPEVGITPGVETTTGPLGQGITNAVGMALAEKLLAAEFNRPGHAIVDHHTYVFLGDGCLMEGISHEAAALAGAWKLGKLVALYDDNGISIDGQVAPWFIDNTPAALRSLWLERDRRRGRPQRPGPRCRHRRCQEEQRRQAHADLLQDQHRQGLAQPPGHGQGPRRAPGRRGNRAHPRGPGLGARPLRHPRQTSTPTGTPRPPAPRPKPPGTRSSPPTPRPSPNWLPTSRAAWPATCLQTSARSPRRSPSDAHDARRHRGQPQGQPAGPGRPDRRPARTAGRLGRPDRLQPDQHQEHAFAARGRQGCRGPDRRRQDRPPHQLRRARVRHGRHHERHRPAWRLHPLRQAPS